MIHKDEACEAFKTFSKEFKMKKVFALLPSNHITVVNLKIMPLKIFVMKMAFFIISLILELLNKMELLKGRIDLCKKWLEPCFLKAVYQRVSGQKQLTLHAIFKTMFS